MQDAIGDCERRENGDSRPSLYFTYLGELIRWNITNAAWQTASGRAGITDLRFHDLRRTWTFWHRQAVISCDELKDLGGWKTRCRLDQYAKFATENLAHAAARIENAHCANVIELSRFSHAQSMKKA